MLRTYVGICDTFCNCDRLVTDISKLGTEKYLAGGRRSISKMASAKEGLALRCQGAEDRTRGIVECFREYALCCKSIARFGLDCLLLAA